MNDFRTELTPARSAFPIRATDRILTAGSCFADSIGSRLTENKFSVWSNKLGAVYNPLSIHQLLQFFLGQQLPSPQSYMVNEGIWFNYDLHSSMSAATKEELETKIRDSVEEGNSFLKSANRVIITYGTAFVYRLKTSGQVVANCHKVPSGNFAKEFLTEEEIRKSFQIFYDQLKQINPNCKIILTVSPVRHLKDTLELNAVSKSILRLACHSLTNQFSDVEYFPAYEILLDDLRDYRFYKTDRLHPTDEAIEYIWEKFISSCMDESAQQFISHWAEIKKDLAHKPFHPRSASHQKFLLNLLKKLENLQSSVDVGAEIQKVKQDIQAKL
ncbi:MAG: GSCFA domain-containing protein [Bacteroidetes bacterium]|nr:GSCFA domain-containing protein [Bacteroidota bacterium]